MVLLPWCLHLRRPTWKLPGPFWSQRAFGTFLELPWSDRGVTQRKFFLPWPLVIRYTLFLLLRSAWARPTCPTFPDRPFYILEPKLSRSWAYPFVLERVSLEWLASSCFHLRLFLFSPIDYQGNLSLLEACVFFSRGCPTQMGSALHLNQTRSSDSLTARKKEANGSTWN